MVEPVDQSTVSTPRINQSMLWREPPTTEQSNQPTASTSKVNQVGPLRRKATGTASLSSLSSNMTATVRTDPPVVAPLLIVYQGSSQPLAYNFFNPAADLTSGDLSVLPSPRSFGLSTEQRPVNRVQVTQPLRRSDSLSRRGSFLSLSALDLFASSPPLQTHFGGMIGHEPSRLAPTTGDHNRPASMCTEIVTLHSTDKYGYRSISFSCPRRY